MSDLIWERYELAKERIFELTQEPMETGVFADFFVSQAKWLLFAANIYEQKKGKSVLELDINLLKEWNEELYRDILTQNYGSSYANPEYAAEQFGLEMGRIMTAIAFDLRGVIAPAFENRVDEIVIRMEFLLEVYTAFKDSFSETMCPPNPELIREILYWYVSDYSDVMTLQRVASMTEPALDFAAEIIMESDLSNPDYLYYYGEYITDNEVRLAKYMASLSDDTINKIADTFTEGYRIGFVNTGKDLSRKKTVNIRYPLGMERVVRQAIRNFELMGLKSVIYRSTSHLFLRQGVHKIGFFGANPNKQYDYDHKEDEALFLDGQFVTRKLECLKAAFEEYRELANGHAGPAVMETFGDKPFVPMVKDSANVLSKEQQKLAVKLAGASGQITNEYIKGEERSFTIIAFPVPDIGDNFEEIFTKTIEINTLDYEKYQKIQQSLIDALDQGKQVLVGGKNGNRTNLTISLMELAAPERQTKFENCVADVNIPVGEVFTSPVLQGTNGILHVSRVFLNELEYQDLSVTVEDGMVVDYNCKNFETEEQNRKYIADNVLYHHETLPMGEFAIGTNTTAYAVGRKYDIASKYPILIAEKTGPHFAFGDTCYSHAEDIAVYNPDGKEIVARDNEISKLRKTDADKAYFNCHTDITIPFDELGYIRVVKADGEQISLIEDGKFVLPGCEELNIPLEKL